MTVWTKTPLAVKLALCGLLSGALCALVVMGLLGRKEPDFDRDFAVIFLAPGILFGLFTVPLLYAARVFTVSAALVMLLVSALSFPFAIFVIGFISSVTASEHIYLAIGGGAAGLLYALVAARLSPSIPVVTAAYQGFVVGALAGLVLQWIGDLFAPINEEGVELGVIIMLWQGAIAGGLGATLYRSRKGSASA